MARTSYILIDDHDVSSLKQQSAGRDVAPHIILIQSQPVFVLTP